MQRRSLVRALATLLLLLVTSNSWADDAANECEAASVRAQRLRNEHALIAARKDLLVCAASSCPSIIRRDCDRWLSEVDAILPTIVPGAQDGQGRDLVDVKVEVDGAKVATRIDGAAVPLDPGPHVVRFVHGTVVVEQRIVVREGEHARPVVAKFPGPEQKPVVPMPPPPREPPPVLTIGMYSFAGLSLAGLTVGLIETIRGVSEYRDLRDSCGATRSCAPSDVEAARRDVLIGDVAFGVAIVSAAATAILFLVRSEWSREPVGRIGASR